MILDLRRRRVCHRRYSDAIRIDPGFALPYLNRGIAYYQKGEYDKANPDYSEIIRLNPDDADAYSNRGNSYKKKGNK